MSLNLGFAEDYDPKDDVFRLTNGFSIQTADQFEPVVVHTEPVERPDNVITGVIR